MVFGLVFGAVSSVYNGVSYMSDKIGQGLNKIDEAIDTIKNSGKTIKENQGRAEFEAARDIARNRRDEIKNKYGLS